MSKPERPLLPAEQLGSLSRSVEVLVALGELDGAQGRALEAKLAAAARALGRRDGKAAAGVLGAFGHQLDALARTGRLAESRGRILRQESERLVLLLSAR